MIPKTVSELMSELSNHPDVGVTLAIKTAVDHLIETSGMSTDDAITYNSLEKIRQAVYDTTDPSRGANVDPMMMLLQLMMSSYSSTPTAGNPAEGALQYIEKMQRQMR